MKPRVPPHSLKRNRWALNLAWLLFAGLLLWLVLLEPWAGFQYGARGVLLVVVGAALLAVVIGLLLYGGIRLGHRTNTDKQNRLDDQA